MSELSNGEATALISAGMYASPPTEERMKEGIERAESWLAAHDREVKAEAWDEGVSALLTAHRWNNAEPWLYLQDNPYRIESQETP